MIVLQAEDWLLRRRVRQRQDDHVHEHGRGWWLQVDWHVRPRLSWLYVCVRVCAYVRRAINHEFLGSPKSACRIAKKVRGAHGSVTRARAAAVPRSFYISRKKRCRVVIASGGNLLLGFVAPPRYACVRPPQARMTRRPGTSNGNATRRKWRQRAAVLQKQRGHGRSFAHADASSVHGVHGAHGVRGLRGVWQRASWQSETIAKDPNWQPWPPWARYESTHSLAHANLSAQAQYVAERCCVTPLTQQCT